MRGSAVAAAAVVAAALLQGCAGTEARAVVEIEMRHSRFAPAAITVPAGTPVRFVLRNADPIPHEAIIGDEAEQQRHETGTDDHHDGIPGQASVEPGETDEIVFTSAAPTTLILGCHLPGHYAYGMRAQIRFT